MSQAGIISTAGGGGGGSPIQTLTGNDAIAVPPTANNINVVGGTSSINNTNGITVLGNAGTSTETFTLTNRISGTVTTTDDVTTQTLVSFNLGAVAGTYNFNFLVAAYNVTDGLSSVYNVDLGRRTNGAAAFSFGNFDVFQNEETTMIDVDVIFSTNIVANTLTIQVTGLLGKTIDWRALGTYIFVS